MADFSPTGIAYGFSQLIGAPFENPKILWIALPLIATLIIVELNLSTSSKDEYGLKQALPNAIVLLFVALDLARMTFSEGFLGNILTLSFMSSLLVMFLAAAVFLIDYYAYFPKKRFFGISAHLPINIIAYVAIVVVYNKLAFSLNLILGTSILLALFLGLFFLIGKIDARQHDPSNFKQDSGKLTWEKKKKSVSFSSSASSKHSSASSNMDSDIVIDPFKGVKQTLKK